MSNIIEFPKVHVAQSGEEVDTKPLRRAYADEMANELFGQVVRIVEGSGALDVLLEADDPAYEEIHPRLIMLKEVIMSIFCFLENVDHELDPIMKTLFEYVGMDEEALEMLAQYNDKYLQRLIEVTREFNNETTEQ